MAKAKAKTKEKEKVEAGKAQSDSKPKTKLISKSKEKKESKVGCVVQVLGPVVDVEFKDVELPEIYNAVRITSEGFDTPKPIDIIVEAEQHLG